MKVQLSMCSAFITQEIWLLCRESAVPICEYRGRCKLNSSNLLKIGIAANFGWNQKTKVGGLRLLTYYTGFFFFFLKSHDTSLNCCLGIGACVMSRKASGKKAWNCSRYTHPERMAVGAFVHEDETAWLFFYLNWHPISVHKRFKADHHSLSIICKLTL